MKRLSTFALFFFLMAPVFCQFIGNDPAFSNNDGPMLQPKKFSYNFTLGSQFTSISGFGSALNTYITPRVSYNLNKRFSIGGGISIIQTNYFNARSFFQNESSGSSNGNFTSGLIFIDGQYIVNKNLTIYGSAFKQFAISQDPLPYNPFNPVSSKGAQGINFNVGYKIGEHIYIQAGFRYTDGINPYCADPFYRHSFINDPFVPQSGFGTPRW
jgi:hypothetical protein